jgi:hypothetical protein
MKKIILLIIIFSVFLLSGCYSPSKTVKSDIPESKIILHNLEQANEYYSEKFNATVGELFEMRNESDVVCVVYFFNITYHSNENYSKRVFVSDCADHFYYDTPGLISHNIYKDGRIEAVQDYD